jgi:hypothetical protein
MGNRLATRLDFVLELPPELVGVVLSYLTLPEVLNCLLVCRRWRETTLHLLPSLLQSLGVSLGVVSCDLSSSPSHCLGVWRYLSAAKSVRWACSKPACYPHYTRYSGGGQGVCSVSECGGIVSVCSIDGVNVLAVDSVTVEGGVVYTRRLGSVALTGGLAVKWTHYSSNGCLYWTDASGVCRGYDIASSRGLCTVRVAGGRVLACQLQPARAAVCGGGSGGGSKPIRSSEEKTLASQPVGVKCGLDDGCILAYCWPTADCETNSYCHPTAWCETVETKCEDKDWIQRDVSTYKLVLDQCDKEVEVTARKVTSPKVCNIGRSSRLCKVVACKGPPRQQECWKEQILAGCGDCSMIVCWTPEPDDDKVGFSNINLLVTRLRESSTEVAPVLVTHRHSAACQALERDKLPCSSGVRLYGSGADRCVGDRGVCHHHYALLQDHSSATVIIVAMKLHRGSLHQLETWHECITCSYGVSAELKEIHPSVHSWSHFGLVHDKTLYALNLSGEHQKLQLVDKTRIAMHEAHGHCKLLALGKHLFIVQQVVGSVEGCVIQTRGGRVLSTFPTSFPSPCRYFLSKETMRWLSDIHAPPPSLLFTAIHSTSAGCTEKLAFTLVRISCREQRLYNNPHLVQTVNHCFQ